MAAPAPPTTAAFQWFVRTIRLGGLAGPLARLLTDVYLPPPLPGTAPVAQLAWLDTGAPLSVVPFAVQQRGFVWQPLPNVRTTWLGQACAVGHIDIWLADVHSAVLAGPFSLLAKFPRSDPPGDPVPILLGLEFLLAHQALFNLAPPPQRGVLQLP